MLRILPQWYSDEHKKLDEAIRDIARRQHIEFDLLMDSKAIEESSSIIMSVLERLKAYSVYKQEWQNQQIRKR